MQVKLRNIECDKCGSRRVIKQRKLAEAPAMTMSEYRKRMHTSDLVYRPSTCTLTCQDCGYQLEYME